MNDKKLLYLKDVAAYFGVTPKIVSKWVDDGKLAAVRTPGGHRRIIASDFYAFLEKHNQQTGSRVASSIPELLIVDDNESFLELYKLIFRNRKYRVTCCGNGREALDLFQRTAFDIILTDVQMPVLDGRKLLREIRRHHRRSKVLVMSNFDINADEFQLMGALDCFNKTIGRNELINKVESVADDKRVARRYPINHTVVLDGNAVCRSLNLSCDGVLLAGTPRLLQAGDRLSVVIDDAANDLQVERDARVVRSMQNGDIWQSALYFEDSIGHELAGAMFGAN